MRKQRGFTLMEMLLAVTILAMAMASIGTVFSMGLQIWKRTQGGGAPEKKLALAFEKMSVEVRQIPKTLGLKDVEFESKSTEFQFPSYVAGFNSKGEPTFQYGRVTYKWNASDQELCREVEDAHALYEKNKAECKPLAGKIQKLQFKYWLYDGMAGSFSWKDTWSLSESKLLPAAVKVSAELVSESQSLSSQRPRLIEQIFVVPVGTLGASS